MANRAGKHTCTVRGPSNNAKRWRLWRHGCIAGEQRVGIPVRRHHTIFVSQQSEGTNGMRVAQYLGDNRSITLARSSSPLYTYTATLTANAQPLGGDILWRTSNPDRVKFTSSTSGNPVVIEVVRSGKSTIDVSYSNSCGTVQDNFTFVLRNSYGLSARPS